MTSRPRSRLGVAVLALALAPLSVLTTGTPSSAASGGTVTGRVTTDEFPGVGAGDITVEAYRHTSDGALALAATARTEIDGAYALSGLPAGDYLLHFVDDPDPEPGYIYLSEWWNDAADAATATAVQVQDGVTTSSIDPSLAFASHVLGTVAGPDGDGRADVDVVAYRRNPVTSAWDEWSRAVTEADGDFKLDDLREGTYRIAFVDSVLGTEYWTKRWQDFRGDVHDIALGDDWVVPARTSMVGLDAQLGIPADIRDGQLVHVNPARISGTPEVGEELYASAGLWFPLPERIKYEWLADGVPIPGADDPHYTPVQADLGATLQLRVTASRFGSYDSTALSPVTAPVGPHLAAAPWNTEPPYIVGRPQVGVPSTAKPGVWTMPEATFTYQWEVDGVAVPGATGSTYTPAPADAGKKLRATVTASVPGHHDGMEHAISIYRVQPGTLTPRSFPRIKGRPAPGATLVVSTGTWNAPDTTVGVQWLASGRAIPGATAKRLTLSRKLARKPISVLVTASAPGYDTDTITLNAPAPARLDRRAGTLVNTSPPTIEGDPWVGEVLTADPGVWSSATPVTFTYAWYVGEETFNPVSTASTYLVRLPDVGKQVWVRVTATAGSDVVVLTSARTEAVTSHPPIEVVEPPELSTPSPRAGRRVTATPGTWSQPDATLSYQWLVDGVAVEGATGTSYTPTSVDVAKTLQVRVTATKDGYRDGVVTSDPVWVLWANVVVLKRPELLGVAKRGRTLRLDLGEWTPTDTAIDIQWYGGDDPLPWATSTKLRLTGRTAAAVLGKQIKVEINMTPPGAGDWQRQYVLFAQGVVS